MWEPGSSPAAPVSRRAFSSTASRTSEQGGQGGQKPRHLHRPLPQGTQEAGGLLTRSLLQANEGPSQLCPGQPHGPGLGRAPL